MGKSAYILVVDDEPDIRLTISEILSDEGYEVAVAENGQACRQALLERRPDLILLDVWMPDIDGITLLKEWSEEGSIAYPVIIISGHGNIEMAVEATRLGAYDFLEKPISLAKLLLAVKHALDERKLVDENIDLRRKVQAVHQPIGKSKVMSVIRADVERIAKHDAWVMISGEAGVGKDVLARYLHNQSRRAGGPFVEIAMASIPKEHAALELFGSEHEGTVHYGLLEQANGGTLVLNEIGDMEKELQAKLMSALENQSFIRLGGTTLVSVNIRIITTTYHDMPRDLKEKKFREDLFYHLNVMPIRIPPLRDHVEDVPELLSFYIDYFATQEHLPFRTFSVAAQNFLRNHPWPGNIRELKNLVQRLLIMETGLEIDLEEVTAAIGTVIEEGHQESQTTSFSMTLREARDDFEKKYFEHHLSQSNYNVTRVAELAGVERTHLYRKLKALGIDPRAVSGAKK